jgi:hypothetical protein
MRPSEPELEASFWGVAWLTPHSKLSPKHLFVDRQGESRASTQNQRLTDAGSEGFLDRL